MIKQKNELLGFVKAVEINWIHTIKNGDEFEAYSIEQKEVEYIVSYNKDKTCMIMFKDGKTLVSNNVNKVIYFDDNDVIMIDNICNTTELTLDEAIVYAFDITDKNHLLSGEE